MEAIAAAASTNERTNERTNIEMPFWNTIAECVNYTERFSKWDRIAMDTILCHTSIIKYTLEFVKSGRRAEGGMSNGPFREDIGRLYQQLIYYSIIE